MTAKHNDEADEIYHRIYRLIKRKIPPRTIAATLDLPLRAVLGVISRLEKTEALCQCGNHRRNEDNEGGLDFLDIYFYPKTRYAVLYLVGYLSKKNIPLLQTELSKLLSSKWKAIALRMSDIRLLCEDAVKLLISNKEEFDALGKFFAILDPSPEIEPVITGSKIESVIDIFGTEHAFEEAAFSRKKRRKDGG